MGDTCTVLIALPKEDLERAKAALAAYVTDEGTLLGTIKSICCSRLIEITIENAEYDWQEDLENLLSAHIDFWAYAGESGERGPKVAVNFRGSFVECAADWGSSEPVVVVTREGISMDELFRSTKYWELYEGFLGRYKAIPINREV
jgi:hypothetical protein